MNANTLHKGETGRFYAWFGAVLLFFFISGACGLIYQVVWTRKLVLLFGTTAYAVSTVLSVFFAGLAAGSLWGGRLADRWPRPLLLYGAFEIIVGLWAILFLVVVTHGESMTAALLSLLHLGRAAGIAARAVLSLALLFTPVALMGATLPLLSKFVTREKRVCGLRIGALYTVNTLGAVCGCALAGFVLLPNLGYIRTTMLGAAANGVIGVLAVALSMAFERRIPAEDNGADTAAQAPGMPEERRYAERVSLVLAAFGISGCCALALEVLWTRLLTIVFLGTTYAYTTMLTTLLIGLAAGGLAAALLVDRIRARGVFLGGVMLLTGVTTLFMLSRIADMPAKLVAWNLESSQDWQRVMTGKFLLAFSALFAPACCFGMTFPLVVKVLSAARGTLGRDVGKLYSVNTLGGVLGSIAGGFVLIPLLGTHHSVVLLASVLAATGAVLTLTSPGVLWWGRAAILAVGAGLFVLAWGRAPENVSLALNAAYVPGDHRVLFYREGVEGTVAVTEPESETGGSNRVLWINRVQATTSIERGVKMNRFQGVLPLLFDRDPRNVLFMCFGSGITCGTLALHDFERIDAVEISPDVIRAAPLFKVDNLDVLERPNVRVHIDDGRNYLLTTRQAYDIITFEPMPLALAGVSTFYTREYYELCLRRLAPGGLVSQWVPLHSLNPEVVRSLVYTFTAVFPEYTAWFVNADLFLIGSNQPLRIDYPRLAKRLAQPEVKAALDKVGLRDPLEVAACFLMDKAGLDAYAAGGELMTDDRPWAEFIAPKLVYERKVPDTLAQLQPHVTGPEKLLTEDTPEEAAAALERRHQAHRNDLEGLRYYYGGMAIGPEAPSAFKHSLDIDPHDYNAQYYLNEIVKVQGAQMTRWEQYRQGEELLQEALRYLPDDLELLELLRNLYAAEGNEAEAQRIGRRCAELGRSTR